MERQFKKQLLIKLLFMLSLIFFGAAAAADEYEEEKDESADADIAVITSQFQEERAIIVEGPVTEIDGHRFIAAYGDLQLFLKDETLSIIIRNQETGAVLYSTVAEPDPGNNLIWQNFMSSGVVLEFLNEGQLHANRLTLLEPGTEIEINEKPNGFSANVYFPYHELGYRLEVTLTEQGFTAIVPYDSLIESTENLLSGLYLFPFLGYAHLGNREGYMFVPDGSGILIYLEHNAGRYSQPFTGPIFGHNIGMPTHMTTSTLYGFNVVRDAETILMPIFGMVHTDTEIGFLGIVGGGGEFSSVIEAYPNGAITGYDWITNRFIYRQSFTQNFGQGGGAMTTLQGTRNQFDATIDFHIVTGEQANYTGLAISYRNYLLENGLVTPHDEDFRVRLDFLGLEQESGMFFNRNVPMTTVANIETIQERLAQSGVEHILGVYQGWQRGGLTVGTLVQNYRVANALGGNRELNRLLQQLQSSPMDLYLYMNPLRMSASAASPLRFSAVRQIDRRIYEDVLFLPVVYSFNVLQPERARTILNDVLGQMANQNVEHLMLTAVSNQLFSHLVGGELQTRQQTAAIFTDMISSADAQFNLLLDQPSSYLWQYTKAFLNTPLRGSSYVFADRDIPFLAIVLRGIIPLYSNYINFESNQQEFFLKLVEQGVRPSFKITYESPVYLLHTNSRHIFSSEFAFFEETIIEFYHELKEVYALTQGSTIVNHLRSGDIVQVTYSNGVVIYINYSEDVQTFNGTRLEGMSFLIGGQ